MADVDIDPELKSRVLDFIRERERVTVADVRREFFPDEMGVPYLYLDRLTAEGHLWVLPAADDGPMVWMMVEWVERHRPDEYLKKWREDKGKRRAAKKTKAKEVKAKKPDPELLEKVSEFIYQHESVSRAGVVQEFFPDDSHTAQLYLSPLEAGGLIESHDEGQTYEWAYLPDPPSVSALGDPGRSASRRSVHAFCTHPSTQAGREKCRKSRGQVSPSQTAEARRAAKQAQPQPAPKPERSAGVVEPAPFPRPHPKAHPAPKDHPWKLKGLTAPVMAGMIYKRMQANRDRQYVFTREWLYRQYPGVDPEAVDAALQRLVDTGRISGIPK